MVKFTFAELNTSSFIISEKDLAIFSSDDFLPSSLELGPEISFNYLIKTYYQVFGKSGNSIVIPEYSNDKLLYNLDFNNLKLWLVEISKVSSYTKIVLLRYFKVPYNITFIITEKLGLNLEEVRDKLLKPYLIYNGMILKDSLDDNDIRLLLYNDYIKESSDTLDEAIKNIKNPLDCNNYPNSLGIYLEQLDSLLAEYLDFNDLANFGLKNRLYTLEIEDNMYQNLYNYISRESNISTIDLSFDMKIDECDNNKTEEFLLMLYFIVTNFFNDMEFYKSTNLTRYSYSTIPSLANIISFISTNDMKKIKIKFDSLIKYNILEKSKYIDSTLHHLIITPYLMDSNYLELLDNKDLLKKIIANFDDTLKEIWCNNETDSFLKQDPKILLRSWIDLLYKINCQNTIEVNSNLLIEV